MKGLMGIRFQSVFRRLLFFPLLGVAFSASISQAEPVQNSDLNADSSCSFAPVKEQCRCYCYSKTRGVLFVTKPTDDKVDFIFAFEQVTDAAQCKAKNGIACRGWEVTNEPSDVTRPQYGQFEGALDSCRIVVEATSPSGVTTNAGNEQSVDLVSTEIAGFDALAPLSSSLDGSMETVTQGSPDSLNGFATSSTELVTSTPSYEVFKP